MNQAMVGDSRDEPDGDEDGRLLVAARREGEAFGVFYDRNQRRVLAYFYRRTFCPHISAELSAETFAQAWSSRHRFNPATGTGRAWLFGIAGNLFKQWLRRGVVRDKARRRLSISTPELMEDDLERLDDLIDTSDLRAGLQTALDHLSPATRNAVLMRVALDLPYKEVARALRLQRRSCPSPGGTRPEHSRRSDVPVTQRPYEDRLRDELMAATTRRPRRSAAALAAGAAVVAAVASFALLGSEPASADVEIIHESGRVIVRLTDLENTPAQVEEATDREGLDVQVEGVPTGPSQVGRFVGDFSTDADAIDVEKLDSSGVTYMAFSIPEGWQGTLRLHLGQRAADGEFYRVASDAYAAGEPLACSGTLGEPLRSLTGKLERFDVIVQGFDAQQQPSPPLSLSDAIDEGLGDEPITGAIATSSNTVLVDVGRNAPRRNYPPC